MRLIDADQLKASIISMFEKSLIKPEYAEYFIQKVILIIDSAPTVESFDYTYDRPDREVIADLFSNIEIDPAALIFSLLYEKSLQIDENGVVIDGEVYKINRTPFEAKEDDSKQNPISMEFDLDKVNVNREIEMLNRKSQEIQDLRKHASNAITELYRDFLNRDN